MTDLAEEVGVYDPLARQREELKRKQDRADRALMLACGAMFAALVIVPILAVSI